ncbi:MAG: hypothetical protein IT380_04510 [Myxococcales bacterium]|nr:hypothetical protein [Myxococcales bacterium]
MKLFLPQTTLEEWATSDKADLVDGKLVVREGASSHPVTPAVHFSRLVSGEDKNALVGRVKTILQLADLGAEHMADSCIVGETAYEVAEGYLTEVTAGAPAAKGGDGKKKSGSPEADLLAAFILDKL